MKSKKSLVTAACIAAIVLGASSNAPAKKKTASPTPTPEAAASPMATAKPARPIPYHGKVASVDATAKTFNVGTRTFKVTDETKMTKQGAAATMSDIVADEEVRGSYWKKEDGSLEAKSVKLGPKTEAEKASHSSKKKTEASPSASPKP